MRGACRIIDERELHLSPRRLDPRRVLLEVATDDGRAAVDVTVVGKRARPRTIQQLFLPEVSERLPVDPHQIGRPPSPPRAASPPAIKYGMEAAPPPPHPPDDGSAASPLDHFAPRKVGKNAGR